MEEIRTNNKLAQWVQDELSNVPPTTDEKRAEAAIKATAQAQYYKDLPSVRAIKSAEERQGVMDSYDAYFTNYTQYFVNYAQNRFMGYAFLSYLAQDAMISRGIRVLADEMTREWGEITSKDQESEEVITELYSDMDRLNTQDAFRKAAHMTGFFGGCLVFLDVREDPNVPLEDEELAKPLFKEGMNGFNESKLKDRYLVGLRPIEPINISPGVYNSTDPTAPDFFEPEHFYILGRKIHRSRFLYFADNIPPQVLKPVYLFFGVPLAQLAFNYVQEFYKAKDVCSRILQKFSCSAISTDVEKLIATNGQNSVKDRVSTIAKYRDNDSIIVLDKENEEFSQVNTPISGLKEMWYAHLEQIPMIFGEPATKLLEISPSGFNSTGEFEMRSFYDSVHTKQSNQFSVPMKRLLDILCFIHGFDPAAISWNWKSLYKLSEREAAEVNKIQADTDQVYYNMGVIGNDDIAKRLIEDKDSGYNNIEVPERIDPFAQEESPLEGENGAENPDETDIADITDEFKEGDHPRKNNGQFTEKGTGEGGSSETHKSENNEKHDKDIILKSKQEIREKAIKETRGLPAVAKIKGNEFIGPDIKSRRESAKQFYNNELKGKPFTNKSSGKVIIIADGGKTFSETGYDNKINSFVYLPEIITNSVYLGKEKDIHNRPNVKGFHYFACNIETDDGKEIVILSAREDNNGKIYYNHHITKEEVDSVKAGIQSGTGTTPSTDSIADEERSVKTYFLILGEKNTYDEKPSFWGKLKGLFDADRWITIHPPHGNKEDKGVPIKIGEDGEVKAGAGGKFTGKKIGQIKKTNINVETRKNNSSGSSRKNTRSYNAFAKYREASEKYNTQSSAYAKVVEETKKRLSDNKEYNDLQNELNKPFVGLSNDDFMKRAVLREKSRKIYNDAFNQVKQEYGYKEETVSYLNQMYEQRNYAINELSKTIKDDINDNSIDVEDFILSFSNDTEYVSELEKLDKKINENKDKMYAMHKEKGYMAYSDPEYKKASQEWLESTVEKRSITRKNAEKNAQKVSSYLKKHFGTDFKVKVTKTTLPEATKKMQDALDGCISTEWDNNSPLTVRAGGTRGSYSWGTIKGGDNSIGTMIHEYAHYLEDKNPEMLANSLAFAKYRTEGEKTSSLKKLTNINYASSEKARPDKFFDPYCGKVYATGRNADYSSADASEIMSMGMQELFTNPVEFAKKDKEYFNFVIANMRGLL